MFNIKCNFACGTHCSGFVCFFFFSRLYSLLFVCFEMDAFSQSVSFSMLFLSSVFECQIPEVPGSILSHFNSIFSPEDP
jgi:hypothetical protein